MALIALVECGLLISRKKIQNYIKLINFFYSDVRWIGDLLKFPKSQLFVIAIAIAIGLPGKDYEIKKFTSNRNRNRYLNELKSVL